MRSLLAILAFAVAGCLELPTPLPTTVADASPDSPADEAPDIDIDVDAGAAARWAYVSAGEAHACALTTDGKLYCWGDNREGEFDPNGRKDLLTPQRIGAPDSYKTVTAGEKHTCAIDLDDRLLCWGDNEEGQVTPADEPREPLGITRVLEASAVFPSDPSRVLDADVSHTCLLTGTTDDARAHCWGDGTAGLGPTPGSPIVLGEVGPNPILDVGDRVSCVYSEAMDPPFTCWGIHNDLMEWAGCDEPCPEPQDPFSMIEPPEARRVSAFSVATNHACFIRDDGSDSVWCWGDNSDDRVWPDQPHPSKPYDTRVAAIDVDAGADHTCAVTPDGDVLCWGDDNSRQTGPVEDGFGRVSIPGESFIQVSAGSYFTCGVTDVGALYCWGRNNLLQLGVPGSVVLDQTAEPQQLLPGDEP